MKKGQKFQLKNISPKEYSNKLRIAHSGKPSGMLGKHHTLETKLKMSKSCMGHPGIKSFLGRKHSRESIAKMKEAHINRCHTTETKQKIREFNLGKVRPIETKIKMSNTRRILHQTPEYRNTQSIAAKKSWQNPEHATRRLRGMRIKPNKAELLLQSILDINFPNEWIYVGDGRHKEFIIGGKCPDFTNTNDRRQLIELFGNYWHRNDNPQDKIAHYKQYGFECIVIWEHELPNLPQLIKKVKEFSGSVYYE